MYSTTGSYDSLCNIDTDTGAMFTNAANQSKKVLYQSVCSSSSGNILYMNTGETISSGGKVPTPEKWAVSVKLVNSANYFCVDWSGVAREQASIGVYFDGGGSGDADCN